MDLNQRIGKRITSARKNRGMTIKELAERTGKLSPARISNWEQGTRKPGPMEAKILANVLNVAASYLLCFTDDTRGEITLQTDLLSHYAPLIPLTEANLSKRALQKHIKNANTLSHDIKKIALDNNHTRKNLFAIYIEDNSMTPIFETQDLFLVDPDHTPQPGQYVVANTKSNGNVIRKYKETNARKKGAFELVASNPDWANMIIDNEKQGKIIATVVEFRRYLLCG